MVDKKKDHKRAKFYCKTKARSKVTDGESNLPHK